MMSRLTCVAAVMFCMLSASGALLAIPKAIEMFRGFNSDLPWLTLLVIKSKYVLVVGLSVMAAVLVAKELLLEDHLKLKLKINLACILVTGTMVGTASFGLLAPIAQMMESLD
jgi:type II secretory pathway component PulF